MVARQSGPADQTKLIPARGFQNKGRTDSIGPAPGEKSITRCEPLRKIVVSAQIFILGRAMQRTGVFVPEFRLPEVARGFKRTGGFNPTY
jgi:hypothetical protein